ncbi:hypothetical protein [Gracilibacillus sp. YIM 98692]|uniref:hypothetical protein n=1 Tax=Gracilibacillus sp. YIM 98692 TaxID=2663532 RepID=UPI0013D52304|nr:hypothetical protein [Gracilibacillus sp. YIM 98692]
MKFNFDTFSQLLHENKSEVKRDQTGLYNVISVIWSLRDIEDINFDAFSSDDVLQALETFQDAPMHYLVMNESLLLDPQNPFVKYYEMEGTVAKVHQAKRMYPLDDDDFI